MEPCQSLLPSQFHVRVIAVAIVKIFKLTTNITRPKHQHLDTILGPNLELEVFVYPDDVKVTPSIFDRHLEVLREVCKRFKGAIYV